jgi:hypothetical protein
LITTSWYYIFHVWVKNYIHPTHACLAYRVQITYLEECI